MRAILIAATLLLAAPTQAAPAPLNINNCVYKSQVTTGTVPTFTHTCWRSDIVDVPVAVDCAARKAARFIPHYVRPIHGKKTGWQPWRDVSSDETPDLWVLVETTRAGVEQ